MAQNRVAASRIEELPNLGAVYTEELQASTYYLCIMYMYYIHPLSLPRRRYGYPAIDSIRTRLGATQEERTLMKLGGRDVTTRIETQIK
jgi:hypothetical protein